MKAITICEPYATLIARGIKRVENRTWAAPGAVVGKRIAIHAGKSKSWLAPGNYGIPLSELTFGAVVATAVLADCVHVYPNIPEWAKNEYPWLHDHEHTEGPVCWILTDVVKLPTPIPFKGAQGFWDIPDELLAGEEDND